MARSRLGEPRLAERSPTVRLRLTRRAGLAQAGQREWLTGQPRTEWGAEPVREVFRERLAESVCYEGVTAMRSYVLTSGAVFGLLALAHVARVFVEGTYLIREPIFLTLTVVSLALCAWAFVLWRRYLPAHGV